MYVTRTLRGKMFSFAMIDYADAKFDEKSKYFPEENDS